MQPLWSQTPQAAAIIASCVANPPRVAPAATSFRRGAEMDARRKYTGRRVELLEAIRTGICDAELDRNDRDEFFRQYDQTVDAAIDTALAAAHYAGEAAKALAA